VAAVAADQEASPERLGHAVPDDGGGHAALVLRNAGQLGAELDPAAQLGQPLTQHLLGAPLGDDQHAGIGHIRGGLAAGVRVQVADDPVALPAPERQVADARGEHPLDHAEVVQDLQASWLQALAARAGERRGRLVEDPQPPPPGQVAGQHQLGRPGPHDQDLRVEVAVPVADAGRWLLKLGHHPPPLPMPTPAACRARVSASTLTGCSCSRRICRRTKPRRTGCISLAQPFR
jgi:hypothetical protein